MEYGKFKSAEELYKGYGELEKSFTRKCQQLAELEKQFNSRGTSADAPPQNGVSENEIDAAVPAQEPDGIAGVGAAVSEADGGQHPEEDGLSETVKIPPAVITGGGNVSLALPNRPKTLAEASALAKQLFK